LCAIERHPPEPLFRIYQEPFTIPKRSALQAVVLSNMFHLRIHEQYNLAAMPVWRHWLAHCDSFMSRDASERYMVTATAMFAMYMPPLPSASMQSRSWIGLVRISQQQCCDGVEFKNGTSGGTIKQSTSKYSNSINNPNPWQGVPHADDDSDDFTKAVAVELPPPRRFSGLGRDGYSGNCISYCNHFA
jgi:hypothetical protein